MRPSERPSWPFLVGMTVASVAAYYLSVLGGLFFLLPLESVRQRRGSRLFWVVSAVVLAGVVGVDVALKALGHSHWTSLDLVILSPAFVFVIGWAVIVGLERFAWRALIRVTLVTAVTGLLTFPLLGVLLNSPEFMSQVKAAFQTVWHEVFQTPGLMVPGLMGQLDPEQFFDLLKVSFLGTFLLVTFLFWSFTWRVSRVFSPGATTGARSFTVPPLGTLFFLGLWGLLLLQALLALRGHEQDWGLLGSALLNAGAIALVVHLWAGWGIVLCLLDRWAAPRFLRVLALIAIVVLGIMPGVSQIVVIVVLSMLAVLELWVSFRIRREEVEL